MEGPSFEMTLKNFMHYARSQWDEDPLYLFDHRFSDTAPDVARDYTLPAYFANDLLALMGLYKVLLGVLARWITAVFGRARGEETEAQVAVGWPCSIGIVMAHRPMGEQCLESTH